MNLKYLSALRHPPADPEKFAEFNPRSVDAAMTAAQGKPVPAAGLLGVTPQKLGKLIRNTPWLLDKWGTRTVEPKPPMNVNESPTQIEALMSTPPKAMEKQKQPATGPLTEAQMAAIYEKEESSLSNGLAKLELDENELKSAKSLHSFHLRHGGAVVDMFGGGLAKNGIKLMAVLKKLEEKIADENSWDQYDTHNEEGQLTRAGLEVLTDLYLRAVQQYERLTRMAYDGAMSKAKMVHLISQANAAGKGARKGKPGFAPMQANVVAQPGSTVLFNSNDERKPDGRIPISNGDGSAA